MRVGRRHHVERRGRRGAHRHGGTGLRRGWGVSTERQQAITETLMDLVPRSGRLSPARLRDITLTIIGRSELWADLVVHDPDVRWYLPLARWHTCDVWLLAWERGQDTDWHDHGGSSGSFAVAEGSLVESYRVHERPQARAAAPARRAGGGVRAWARARRGTRRRRAGDQYPRLLAAARGDDVLPADRLRPDRQGDGRDRRPGRDAGPGRPRHRARRRHRVGGGSHQRLHSPPGRPASTT